MLQHSYVRTDKYRAVSKILSNDSGRLLDIGARDRRLAEELNLRQITYFSADIDAGHDFQLNLEQKLNLPDESFEFVVALDVLEHVENIHLAFHELARITSQKLIIALPNMSTMLRRLIFLRRGHLGTGKYDLHPDHQGDRHRWLTLYPQINHFVQTNAQRDGFFIEQLIEEIETGFYGKIGAGINQAGLWLIKHRFLPKGFFTGRCIYVLRRSAPLENSLAKHS